MVIVGAGFGGLRAAQGLRGAPVDVTVVDQHNYHTFTPLLYQVATAGLEPESIAHPVRRILRGAPNVRFRLARVTGIDFERRRVMTSDGDVSYDYVVLAAGSVTNYYGLDALRDVTSSLRDLDDAEVLRDHVLAAFEAASVEMDPVERQRLMTVVIVGAGPTGVELAGAIAELKRHVLPKDYPELDISSARIVLLERGDRVLPMMPPKLQVEARKKLEAMGVTVRLGAAVAAVDEDGVTLEDGEKLAAGVVVWVAGIRAAPLADVLKAPKGPSGRIAVSETLQLPGHPEVFIIGDMAQVADETGRPLPMYAPVAIQEGAAAAENIVRLVRGQPAKRFVYRDQGIMATIGRKAAVARIYGVQISGFLAWMIWLTLHLIWLIGFRNKLLVLVNWAWNYFTYERAVRLIRRTP